MSEMPVDKTIDRKSNVVLFRSDQSQPENSFVHNLPRSRPSASLEDELGITEKHPALRLQMRPAINTLLKSKKLSKLGTLLFQWIKTNMVMLVNAGSLIGT